MSTGITLCPFNDFKVRPGTGVRWIKTSAHTTYIRIPCFHVGFRIVTCVWLRAYDINSTSGWHRACCFTKFVTAGNSQAAFFLWRILFIVFHVLLACNFFASRVRFWNWLFGTATAFGFRTHSHYCRPFIFFFFFFFFFFCKYSSTAFCRIGSP